MRISKPLGVAVCVGALVLPVGVAGAREGNAEPIVVGSSLPDGFPEILDASTGNPIIGFGGAGHVRRPPVIFLHGNDDVPFPTVCGPYGDMQEMAQYFADRGYRASELWGSATRVTSATCWAI